MQVSIVYASTNKAPMVSMYSRSTSTLISFILWQVTSCDRSWQTLIKIRHGSKINLLLCPNSPLGTYMYVNWDDLRSARDVNFTEVKFEISTGSACDIPQV